MNTLRPQVKKNVSSLRKGLGWFATLVGVVLLIVLVGCPEDDSSSSSAPVTVALTDEATNNLSVTIRASALEDGDTTVWVIVFPAGTTLAGDDVATQIANVKAGGAVGLDSDEASVNSIANVSVDISSSDKTQDLTLAAADVALSGASSITAGTSYVVYVVIGNDTVDVDRVSSRLVVTATDETAPTATITGIVAFTSGSASNSFTITAASLDESATAYWIVVIHANTVNCTADNVISAPATGSDVAILSSAETGAAAARGSAAITVADNDFEVTSVPAISGGSHDACIVLEDAAGNRSDVITVVLP